MNRVAVADTGPLHYLILIDCAEILARLFDRILIPAAVRDELLNSTAPAKVKNWIGGKKTWLSIETLKNSQAIRGLHRGEAEALQLALQHKTPFVLMDDLDGRAAAKQLGLLVVGTIGLLERAAELQLIELPEVIAKLRRTNFFAAPELLEAALERDRTRRKT
jgi:hypothetical protein